jgi:hypothetical protein
MLFNLQFKDGRSRQRWNEELPDQQAVDDLALTYMRVRWSQTRAAPVGLVI